MRAEISDRLLEGQVREKDDDIAPLELVVAPAEADRPRTGCGLSAGRARCALSLAAGHHDGADLILESLNGIGDTGQTVYVRDEHR